MELRLDAGGLVRKRHDRCMWVLGWFALTVSAPLFFFEATHRWEEDPTVAPMLWWSVGAAFAAALLSRSVWFAGILLPATLAVFRFVMPLSGPAPWLLILAAGAAAVLLGALAGRRFALRRRPVGLILSGVAMVAGAFLAPATLRLGAEGSTVQSDEGRYGPAGPVTLPRPGEYAIYAVGFADPRPACTAGGRSVALLGIQPGGYGGDAATYTWIGRFRVDAAGPHTVTCPSAPDYVIGDVPVIRGAVARVLDRPLALILLLGALPGLFALVRALYARRWPVPPPGVPPILTYRR
jgi:hypothetical protein